jgi:two-component system, LytTR family, sensor kinase
VTNRGKKNERPQPGYWLCQLIGWTGFTLFQTAIYILHGDGWGLLPAIAISSVASIQGFLLTHAARPIVIRQGWLQMPTTSLLKRMVVVTVVLSALYAVCTTLDNPLELYLKNGSVSFDLFMGHPAHIFLEFLYYLFIFGLWFSLYLTAHFVRERRRAEIDSLQLAAALSESRLHVLQAQINPHFLFNSLNNLRALIDDSPERARDAVTRLASVLRYSLSVDNRRTVPLKMELDAASDYLELERIRFEDRLTVRKNIDPVTLNCAIPPMLVQTLFENSIKHGVSKNEGSSVLSIDVTAEPDNKRVRIVVQNQGDLHNGSSNSTCVGLRNARERLERLFGQDASLDVFQERPGLVKAVLELPYRDSEAAPEGNESNWIAVAEATLSNFRNGNLVLQKSHESGPRR